MATISRVKTWATGDVLTASDLNAEFNNILNDYNGGITNANISASAAIATSKINTTFPSGTIVGTSDSQTLTNKTLTSPTITGPTITGTIAGNPTITKPTINGSVQAYTDDSDSATITFNMLASNLHNVTLGGNRTLAVSNVSAGQAFLIILKQDGTGSRTVTWWSGIVWAGASAPTLSTTASRWDIFAFIYDGTRYFGSIVGQNYG